MSKSDVCPECGKEVNTRWLLPRSNRRAGTLAKCLCESEVYWDRKTRTWLMHRQSKLCKSNAERDRYRTALEEILNIDSSSESSDCKLNSIIIRATKALGGE
jgi:hypothetical protein